jgi:hypothetical protein
MKRHTLKSNRKNPCLKDKETNKGMKDSGLLLKEKLDKENRIIDV